MGLRLAHTSIQQNNGLACRSISAHICFFCMVDYIVCMDNYVAMLVPVVFEEGWFKDFWEKHCLVFKRELFFLPALVAPTSNERGLFSRKGYDHVHIVRMFKCAYTYIYVHIQCFINWLETAVFTILIIQKNHYNNCLLLISVIT